MINMVNRFILKSTIYQYKFGDKLDTSSFLPISISKLDYQQWINLIIHGGYNLIRIWGGGQYEKDILYSLCDEAGILIWQDFMCLLVGFIRNHYRIRNPRS